MRKNHSISSPTSVVSYLEWVSEGRGGGGDTTAGAEAAGQDRGEHVEGSGVEVMMVQMLRK